MGFKFRKRLKVLPGVHVNVGKKGVSSVSVGGKGATLNIKERGDRKNFSSNPLVFVGAIIGACVFFYYLFSFLYS